MRKIALGLIFILFLGQTPNAFAVSSLAGKSCKTIKAKTSSGGISFTCALVKNKKIWIVTPKPTVKAPTLLAPVMPIIQFESYFDDKGATGDPYIIVNAITGISEEYLVSNRVTGFNFAFELPTGAISRTGFISVDNYIKSNSNPAYKIWYMYSPIKQDDMGKSFKGKVQIVNSVGTSDWLNAYTKTLKQSTPVPTTTPSPSPSNSAYPTPSATPNPSPISTPMPEIGCSVNYLTALPYSSQRISILGMNWEKDSNGYVSAIFSLRNDNSMALRLVEFSFYLMHKGSLITTQSTLQGNHFFIQDDSRFNSLEGSTGAWLPGQTRSFKIQTNQILECRSISLLSAGFNVRQGIGA